MAKRIVITHMWSDRNKGDSAIVLATLQVLRQCHPDAEMWLLSEFASDDVRFELDSDQVRAEYPDVKLLGNPLPVLPVQRGGHVPKTPHGIDKALRIAEAGSYLLRAWRLQHLAKKSAPSWRLGADSSAPACVTPDEWQTLRAMSSADSIVSKGGGFVYGAPGVQAAMRLVRVLFPMMLAESLGRRVLLAGQSIGPFPSGLQKLIASRVLGKVSWIGAREDISAQLLRGMVAGGDAVVEVVPDMTFALAPATEREVPAQVAAYLHDRPKPWVGATVRRFGDVRLGYEDPTYQQYLDGMAELFLHIADSTGGTVFIWPQCTGPGEFEDDRIASRHVCERLHGIGRLDLAEHIALVDDEITARVLKLLYGKMDAFVATRFHSAIFALSQGVPTIAIDYWGPKAKGIMSSFGCEQYVFAYSSIRSADLCSAFDHIWERRHTISCELEKASANLSVKVVDALGSRTGGTSAPAHLPSDCE